MEREQFSNSFMGIQETSEFSDQGLADSFLSDNTEIIEIGKEPEKKKEPEKQEPKKEVKKEEEEFDAKTELLGEVKEEDEDEKKDPEEKEDEKEFNQFEALSKELYKIDVFSVDEGEEPIIAKTPQEFKDLFENQGQRKATAWLDGFLNQFGEDYREMFEAVFVSGVDPREYISVYTEIKDLSGLDLTMESNQEQVIREYYTRQGWKPANINNKVQKLKDYSDLEDEAKNVHELLLEEDTQRLAEMEDNKKKQMQAQMKAEQDYKTSISKILTDKTKEKEFDGIPLSSETAQKAFDFLYNKKYKTPDGQLLTEWDKFILETRKPENISERVKIALLKLSNFDFSKIQKKAISTESNKMFSEFAQKTAKKETRKVEDSWLKL